jgi:hypothetical protein
MPSTSAASGMVIVDRFVIGGLLVGANDKNILFLINPGIL